LVIDDDTDIADAIVDVLKAGGYQAVAVYDGNAAMAQAKDGVGLVLLDWRLPSGPSGAPLVRKLRELCGAPLPIVVLSADPLSLAEARLSQVTDYVPKPFEIADLLHVVDQYFPD
jgi:DNA-binding response OmpR family regulator